jgi:GTPase SAR1 family protein
MIFDVTRWDSFQNLPQWINELWRSNGRGCVPLILVGNKTDLRRDDESSISPEYGLEYSQTLSDVTKQYGFTIPYIETSAKTGQLVEDAFHALGNYILSFLNTSAKKE